MTQDEIISTAPTLNGLGKSKEQQLPRQSPVYTPHIEINRVFEPILAKNLKTLSNIEVEWVVEGLLAKNYLTLFAAREKMGKTTLVKALIKSLATGEKFLGQNVKQSRVLVITEEHAGHWNRRLEDIGLTDCETVWFITQPFNTRLKLKEWSDYLITSVAPYCKQNTIDVLIIDTISPIWPVIDENNAAEVQSALLPLLSITKQGISVLPLHHYSKAGGIRGSTAIAATPDILLNFSKPQGDEDTTRRLLKCVGRFEETPEQLLLDYRDGEYILLGTPQNVARQEKHAQVKQVLENFDSGATLHELLESWSGEGKKPSRSMLRIYLNELLLARQIYQIGEKEIKGGKALVYSLNPVNGINYQGSDFYVKNEANNPNNFDTGAISETQIMEVFSKEAQDELPF